ncbi:STAS domain-containing protein, partial [Candidatus Latescibacterota bacterium]
DILICNEILKSISIENVHVYRDIFSNITSDGLYKIILNMSNIVYIDSAGLALLISFHESVKSFGGGLRLAFLSKSVNNRFLFAQISDLIKVFPTIEEASENWEDVSQTENSENDEDLNICMSCTFINESEARYCSFCGTNLIMGKEQDVLDLIRKSIMHRILSDAKTDNLHNINKNRNMDEEKTKIPQEFLVELIDNNLELSYISSKTLLKGLKKDQIAIETPKINGISLPVHHRMKVRLKTSNTGNAIVETKVLGAIPKMDLVIINYSKEASIVHSKKNFSVAPNEPLPVNIIDPSFQSSESVLNGKILELSRVRMIIFSEDIIPANKSLAVSFKLPDGTLIATPLVIAQKKKDRFMYDIEFIIIDEKDRSKLIQYMYRRQIEQAKGHEET